MDEEQAKPDLADVRARIDAIDRRIQELIAERARFEGVIVARQTPPGQRLDGPDHA